MNSADQSLAERVRLWHPRRHLQHMPPHRADRLIDRRRNDAVPIMEDEPVDVSGDHRAELLDRPRPRRMRGDAPVDDPTRADLKDDENVQDPETDPYRREEVTCDDRVRMVPDTRLQARAIVRPLHRDQLLPERQVSRTSSRCPRSPNASARPTRINSWSMTDPGWRGHQNQLGRVLAMVTSRLIADAMATVADGYARTGSGDAGDGGAVGAGAGTPADGRGRQGVRRGRFRRVDAGAAHDAARHPECRPPGRQRDRCAHDAA